MNMNNIQTIAKEILNLTNSRKRLYPAERLIYVQGMGGPIHIRHCVLLQAVDHNSYKKRFAVLPLERPPERRRTEEEEEEDVGTHQEEDDPRKLASSRED